MPRPLIPPLERWVLGLLPPTRMIDRCEDCGYPFSGVSLDGMASAWESHMDFAHPSPSVLDLLFLPDNQDHSQ